MSEASVKLLSRGVETLTDQELLELLLDDGDSERLAGALLSSFEGRLAALGYADIARLRMAAGIGLKRAARIQAAVELGRRVLAARELGPDPIGSSNDVVRIFRPLLTEMKHEECWCLYLNTGNRIVERQRVSQGGVQATVVDHRLVIKRPSNCWPRRLSWFTTILPVLPCPASRIRFSRRKLPRRPRCSIFGCSIT